MQKLDEKQVLTNKTRQIIFNCLMEGCNLREASEKAKITHQYARRLATEGNITNLVLQKKAEIGEKCKIRAGQIQLKYLELAEMAIKDRKLGVARACYADLMKSIGGFIADAPSDKALQAKQIDAERAKYILKGIEAYKEAKYLAEKPKNEAIEAENVVVLEDC